MRRKRRLIILMSMGIVAGIAFIMWRLSAPAPLYRLTVFTALTGETIDPRSLNDRGGVVGFIRRTPAVCRVFFWDRTGGMQDLGPVTGGECAINDAGQIATTSTDSNGNEQAALRDPNGAVQLLGTLGGALSVATALNNRDQVVGWSATAPDASGRTVMHAFLWGRASGMRDLGALGQANSVAQAVNDAGQVFGFCQSEPGGQEPRALLLESGGCRGRQGYPAAESYLHRPDQPWLCCRQGVFPGQHAAHRALAGLRGYQETVSARLCR